MSLERLHPATDGSRYRVLQPDIRQCPGSPEEEGEEEIGGVIGVKDTMRTRPKAQCLVFALSQDSAKEK